MKTHRRTLVRRPDYTDRFPEALRDLSKWIGEGRIVRKFHIVEGLEKAPDALPLLFTGGNTGKLFVPTSFHYRFSALTHWKFAELFMCRANFEGMNKPRSLEGTIMWRHFCY